MEISSLSSPTSASLFSTTQAADARRVDQEQRAQQAQQAQSAQPSENQSAVRANDEAENSRPTVNANGQVVGTRINTTA